MGEIVLGVLGHQRVEIVAPDPALHLGEALFDLGRFARAQRQQFPRDGAQGGIGRQLGQIRRHRAEMGRRSVGQHGVDGDDVVARGAVAQRDRVPQELLPVMPPMVAREAVETSTGNHSPCGFSWRFSSSSTMPGCTATQVQRRPCRVMIHSPGGLMRSPLNRA